MTLGKKDDVILNVLTKLRSTIKIEREDLIKHIKDNFTRLNDEDIEDIISLMTQSGFIKHNISTINDRDRGFHIEPEGMKFLRDDEFKQNQIKILKNKSRHNRYLLLVTFVIASGVIIAILNTLIDLSVKYNQTNSIVLWNVLLWAVFSVVIIVYFKIFIELFWKRKNKKNDTP